MRFPHHILHPVCLAVSALALANTATTAAEPAPVAQWHFDDVQKDTAGEYRSQEMKPGAGPRDPRYPGFSADNKAMRFLGDSSKTVITVKDNGPDGPQSLRFKKGEVITMEAWVKPDQISGEVYLLGKGRLGTKEFGSNNQNYGLRLKNGESGLRLGFIFSTTNDEGKDHKFHVWWSSDKDNMARSTWHHVAVTYTFGQKGSLRGYIDGKQVPGEWSFGGDTDRAPVTDGEVLLIGTGAARQAGNSYKGWLDAVAIHRGAIDDASLKKRYAFSPAPPPVMVADVPEGKVLVQLCEENVPNSRGWPEDNPVVADTYTEDVFGFSEVPHKYVASGVRGDRAPLMVRASAKVNIPAGTHRLLLRARGGSRVFIDGREVLTTPFPKGDTGGHGHTKDQDTYLDLGPDFRFAPPGNRESWIHFKSKGGSHLVMMETVVGVGGMRPELGETVVAISLEDSDKWSLLSANDKHVPYTDAGWATFAAERHLILEKMNAAARAKLRDAQAPFWSKRREAAKAWLASSPEVKVPDLPEGYAANNEIDRFVAARIAKVAEEYQSVPKGGVDYFKQVQPILEAKCYSCHQGGKAKGELWLDTLAGALQGGEEEGPAVVPGAPEKSSLIHRVTTDDEDLIMPPKGDRLTEEEVTILTQWIKQGAGWPEFNVPNLKPTELSNDLAFLRRVTLDTIGLVPTETEIKEFLADKSPDKRAKVIDKLLADPRWADNWMGYWQDVLAENPNIINPTLNNTGPFRWWLYESLMDDKPMDLFVTELVRMDGSDRLGGPAGFGVASQNDAPMAEKGAIISSAFLGVEMKCARCHDAPAHVSLQKDLFQLAAMLSKEPVKVPTTSSVPMDKLHEGGRKPLIKVTLAPGSEVTPDWPFARYADAKLVDQLSMEPDNSRDRLATLITAPQNERFAQVTVNRLWQRLMGRGIVENVADWEKGGPTHPELLQWLGREFVRQNYSMKAMAKLILNSQAYQRATDPSLEVPGPLYVSPAPRRQSAEQIVDSLFVATGKPFDLEEVSLDLDSNRGIHNSITLGIARRSWMLTSTSNERDRPSLTLPRLQAVATVLEAFGWRGARQDPISIRDTAPNTLQPAILSNGTMGNWLTVLSDDHGFTKLALEQQTLDQLIDRLFLRLLTRKPTEQERADAKALLTEGYDTRITNKSTVANDKPTGPRKRPYYFTWSNHLDSVANTLGLEAEEKARKGDPPTEKLTEEWRQRLEDLVWTILNTPEWMFTS